MIADNDSNQQATMRSGGDESASGVGVGADDVREVSECHAFYSIPTVRCDRALDIQREVLDSALGAPVMRRWVTS